MKTYLALWVAALVWPCAVLQAAVLISEDFAADANGWDARTTEGAGTKPAVSQGALGSHAGALRFGLTATGVGVDSQFLSEDLAAADGELDDVVRTFILGTTKSIIFDFYAGANAGGGQLTDAPAAVHLYFGSSVADAYWISPALSVGGGGWNSLWANLGTDSGWTWQGVGTPTFAASMAAATEVGLWVIYQPWNTQQYGLDNFVLNDTYITPEPGAMLALVMGLLSMAIPFRRQLDGWLPHKRQLA